jgi:23S rRNA pseudoU1915 N3-methylase RlmH
MATFAKPEQANEEKERKNVVRMCVHTKTPKHKKKMEAVYRDFLRCDAGRNNKLLCPSGCVSTKSIGGVCVSRKLWDRRHDLAFCTEQHLTPAQQRELDSCTFFLDDVVQKQEEQLRLARTMASVNEAIQQLSANAEQNAQALDLLYRQRRAITEEAAKHMERWQNSKKSKMTWIVAGTLVSLATGLALAVTSTNNSSAADFVGGAKDATVRDGPLQLLHGYIEQLEALDTSKSMHQSLAAELKEKVWHVYSTNQWQPIRGYETLVEELNRDWCEESAFMGTEDSADLCQLRRRQRNYNDNDRRYVEARADAVVQLVKKGLLQIS